MNPELKALLEKAKSRPMTEAELREQRLAFVRAEAEFGNDADEAAYAQSLRAGDEIALARLKHEADARIERCNRAFDREDGRG